MKTNLFLAAMTALMRNTTARADVFPAGYTFTYHFDSLPITMPPVILTADFLALDAGNGVPITSVISWEMFESLPVGTPVASGLWSPGSIPLADITRPTWQDGEGSFRISIISGSQSINGVFIYLSVLAQPGSVYQLTVVPPPVPEPTTLPLLYAASSVVALVSWHRKKSLRPAI